MEKEDLKILWLDDKREPYNFFKKAKKNFENGKEMSCAAMRTYNFYSKQIYTKYNVEFDWVKKYDEFVDYITTNGIPQFISFDKDLTKSVLDPQPTGIECAQWLKQYCKETGQKMPTCFAHTANAKDIPELEYVLGDAALHEPCVGIAIDKYNSGMEALQKRLKNSGQINENKRHYRSILSENALRRIIRESLIMLTEGSTDERKARNYMRAKNLCPNLDEEQQNQYYWNYLSIIKDKFGASDSGDNFNNKHISGIVRLLMDNALTPSKKPNIYGGFYKLRGTPKEGIILYPKIEENVIETLQSMVYNMAKDPDFYRKYSNDFRVRLGKVDVGEPVSFESLMNDYYDENYLGNLLIDKSESPNCVGESGNKEYYIFKASTFEEAKEFAVFMPDLCYLRRLKKFNVYGAFGIFIFIRKDFLKAVRNSGKESFDKYDDYGNSCIAVSFGFTDKDGKVISIQGRYGWHQTGGDKDYTRKSFYDTTGTDVYTLLPPQESKQFRVKAGEGDSLIAENKIRRMVRSILREMLI